MEERLPAHPTSARRARRFVVDAVHRLHWDAVAEIAELLVSELVSNAVLHAGTELRLRVTADGLCLRVEVMDASPAPALRRSYSESSTTGRGLALVEALAARWGSDPVVGDGKSVWFELDRRHST